MEKSNYGFGTRAIHAWNKKDTVNGALTTPIYQTSTFVFDSCEQGAARFAGEERGYIYSRLGNPTSTILEEKIAALENGEAAAVTSSGMGAITSAIWTICKAGDHIISDGTLYGCTYAYLSHGISRYGVDVSFVDTSSLEEIEAALRPNTTVVYLETPANPNLKITDIKAVSDLVHAYNPEIKVICDNTFATPYLQRPLELGADVVVHSLTKYMNGHGDVIAGAVVGKADYISQVKLFGIKDMTGSVIGPFESFLILRGMKTLEVRMDRHCDSAKKIVEFLKGHPAVEAINFPGLPEHPGHEVAKKQMSRPGAMISFEVKGGRANGAKLLNSLKLCTLAVSLGDAETLIEHPASMTHSPYSAEELKAVGISEGLVRLSVGLENPEDIIADLKAGLDALTW